MYTFFSSRNPVNTIESQTQTSTIIVSSRNAVSTQRNISRPGVWTVEWWTAQRARTRRTRPESGGGAVSAAATVVAVAAAASIRYCSLAVARLRAQLLSTGDNTRRLRFRDTNVII